MQWTPEQIRRHRLLRGWSQDDAAQRLGVSRRSISSWEAGEARPQGRHADALDRVFGTTPDEPTLATATDMQLVAELARRLAAHPHDTGGTERDRGEGHTGLPDTDLRWPRRTRPQSGHTDQTDNSGA